MRVVSWLVVSVLSVVDQQCPKPLLPVLDKPSSSMVRSLPMDMVDEVVVAGDYKVDQIKAHFDAADAPYRNCFG